MEQGAPITLLLARWSEGNPAALAELTPHVYRELRIIAQSYLGTGRKNHTLQPTALVHEAWLRLAGQARPPQWEDRHHFFGVAARLMRLVLVDSARAHHAAKRGGGVVGVTLEGTDVFCSGHPLDVLEIDQALDRLAEVDERKAKVIELRYFGGLEQEEIARTLGFSLTTVKRDLRLGEAWLGRFLSRNSRP
jgi:RNA polymerase sigma factor (TIGR02999 family)